MADHMEEPLFGEQKKGTKVLVFAGAGIVGLILLISSIIGFVFGFKGHPQHIVFVITLLFLGAILFFVFRWYQANELDPKFRWIIAGFAFTLILACVTLNIYAWQPRVVHPSEKCHKGNGLYLHNTERCIEIAGSLDRCLGEHMCMCFDRWFPDARATCQNCTANPCKGYAPPKPPSVQPPGQQPPGQQPPSGRPLPPTSRPLPPGVRSF